MADVIRDVVINIRLKQLDNKLTVPDTRGVQSAVAAVNKEIEKTGGTKRKVSAAFAAINKSERVALGKRIVSERQLQKELAKTRVIKEKAASTFKKIQAAERASVSKRQAVVQQQQLAAKQVVEQNRRAADSFVKLGDGVFTVVRGAALMFTDTDDGLKKFVENVAIAQGGLDLFKGSIGIVRNLRAGILAWTTASKAAAVANNVVAASNTAVATTAGAATVATRGLMVALGPIAIVLAAAGVAYAAYIAFQRKSTKASKEEAKAEREKAKAIKESERNREATSIKRIRDTGAFDNKRFSSGSGSAREISALRQRRSEDRFISGETKREGQIRKINQSKKRSLELDREILESNKRFDNSFGKRVLGPKGVPKGGLTAKERAGLEKQSIDNLAEDKELVGQNQHKRETANFDIETVKLIVEKNRQASGLLRDRIGFMNRARDIQQQIVNDAERENEIAKEKLKTAKQLVETEKQRIQSVESSIHRLDPEKKARLKAISDKAGRNERLTDRELEFARQHAGSSKTVANFVEREQAKRGRKDAEGITSGFADKNPDGTPKGVLRQEGSRLSNLQSKQTKAESDLKSKGLELGKQIQLQSELLAEQEKERQAIFKLNRTMVDQSRTAQRRIDELQAELDELKINNQ